MFNICIIIIHNKKRGLKLNLTIYDLWTYFRMGFATYTSKPISVLNMILLLVISVSNDLSMVVLIFDVWLAVLKEQIKYKMELALLKEKEIVNDKDIALYQLSLVESVRRAHVKIEPK